MVDKWKHSKSPDFVSNTPRLIILTSKCGYLARDILQQYVIPKRKRNYAKVSGEAIALGSITSNIH